MNAARKAPSKDKASQTGDGSLIAHLQDVVQEIVARVAGLTRRRMLVSDSWFVDDKAFALVSRQARVVVRIPDPRVQDELLSLAGASPWQIAMLFDRETSICSQDRKPLLTAHARAFST